ncbi:MAG TPA: hypothetical protein VKT82_07270 [Ktedonobacterales bacterium]|nr:hypothetical protein [Ktedonobacterales bacterium]
MAAPAPTPPMTPRRIAFRQGLLFGGGLGIAALVLNLCLGFVPYAGRFGFSPVSPLTGNNVLVYLIGFAAFFFAGWRTAQQTGRVDIGGLAGFWAGLVGGLVLIVIDIVLVIYSYSLTYRPSVSVSSVASIIVSLLLLAGRDAILALLLGAGLGVLGGFIGRTYATSGPAAAQPNQPPATPPPAAAPQPPPSPPSQP